jgi:acyl carrier protein
MSDEVADVVQRVRAVLEVVLKRSLSHWSDTDQLENFPDTIFDSLVRLEVATRLETEFGLPVGSTVPGDLVTVRAIALQVEELTAAGGT